MKPDPSAAPDVAVTAMRLDAWLAQASDALAAASAWQQLADESPRREAQWLLASLLNKSMAWLQIGGDVLLTPAQQEQAQRWLQRRCSGEPLAYITGEQEFWSLPLRVSPATLIPRADTETLVETALALHAQHLKALPACRLLDMGTGSGAVALALASELNRPLQASVVERAGLEPAAVEVTAVDCSADALAVARSNGETLRLPVRWLASDWFAALTGERFHLIVSNPPYIDAADPHLAALQHEPASALVAAQSGLADLYILIEQSPDYLMVDAWLLLEHGYQQAGSVRAALQSRGFVDVQSWRDLGGHPRVSGGRWPTQERPGHAQ